MCVCVCVCVCVKAYERNADKIWIIAEITLKKKKIILE